MTPYQEILFNEAARLLQISLAADEECKRIHDKYFSSGPVFLTETIADELQTAWDNRARAHQEYREAMESFRENCQ